ncbi:Fe-Mn family superoxide dismutase [Paenibacillus apiarius]|uniref:superoxide dismutase n=1 Tax=Paenibacillus apiarius TaxID=46240 RepID=A0ABT4DXA3_9BACL|nr:Fe-Mn family superoxide dismutase [Paenibacillus apiarius]MBN3524797.1 DUF2935 domain-containing protein [Paenibacillus apiarius]MCY9515688.1 DUF2935 domain-containing protein [Paenibacillus apiarius]MCY9521979.1 DUF2935 domain-containing protein [Paenibacillus apiarius]MCY9550525.1 DUF2935 domain-containing protein [Paenibacillus apiarius]MCY9559826.1 DUF2935 domain-containing protein [Paenibacillus apiarius]
MLHVYGPLMPVRLLEEIVFWKKQEEEHTEVIRAIVPQLEDVYVQLLLEWEQVFAKTAATAAAWLDSVLNHPHAPDAANQQQLDLLLKASVYQSEQFLQQLGQIKQHSQAVKSVPLAPIVLDHIASESQYFLNVVHELTQTPFTSVSPSQTAAHIHAAMDTGVISPYQVSLQNSGMPNWTASAFDAKEELYESVNTSHQQSGVRAYIGNSRAWHPGGGRQKAAPAGVFSASYARSSGDEYVNGAAPSSPSTNQPPPDSASSYESSERADEAFVPIGGHRLPPLPYAYNALEPYIDETTMRIHHDKHHQSYVDGLNKAELALAEARRTGNFELIKYWENELAFNGAGHYLHTIFWNIMNPRGGGQPTGTLRKQIEHDFGSVDAFKQQFSKAAEKVEGGGWTILVWSPRSRRLEILQAEKHQNLSQWDVIPLLPLDVWEHAYYLKHQNERVKYIDDWWHVVYWPAVAERFCQARKLKWTPY